MSIWRTTTIEQTPQVTLVDWTIRELPGEERHFVGFNVTEIEGRVSSQILEFDPCAMLGRTRSGRIYRLEGPMGYNGDAEYTWSRWLAIYNIDRSTVKTLKEDEIDRLHTSS